MRSFIVTTVLAGILAVCAPAARAQISVGIFIGAPPPPRVVLVLPPEPSPGFIWVTGYWYPVGRRYVWHPGYWTRPPYPGALWVVPRYEEHRYYEGYWDGPRGRFEHEHRWDEDRDRDSGRWHGHGRGHDHDRDHDHDHDH